MYFEILTDEPLAIISIVKINTQHFVLYQRIFFSNCAVIKRAISSGCA